jgi:hypothetical protein
MRRFEEDCLRTLAAQIFDDGRGIDPERLDWAIADLELFLRGAGPRTTFLFRVALYVVAWMPLFFVARLGPLSRLDKDSAALYLDRFDRSRLSPLLLLPKAVFALVYFEHPDSLKEIGFDGSCMMGELPGDVGLVQLARSHHR